jgi:hypothetical protein
MLMMQEEREECVLRSFLLQSVDKMRCLVTEGRRRWRCNRTTVDTATFSNTALMKVRVRGCCSKLALDVEV